MPDDRRPEDMGYVPTEHSLRYARRYELALRCSQAIELLDKSMGLDVDSLLCLYRGLTVVYLKMDDTTVAQMLRTVAHPQEKERENAKVLVPHPTKS